MNDEDFNDELISRLEKMPDMATCYTDMINLLPKKWCKQ